MSLGLGLDGLVGVCIGRPGFGDVLVYIGNVIWRLMCMHDG